MVNILKERFPSNIAYHIMSYAGPHPVAAIIQEHNRFLDLNIFPKRFFYGGGWNNLYGLMKRDKWREKHFITYAGHESAGGVVCVRDNWFIWCRYRDPGNTFH